MKNHSPRRSRRPARFYEGITLLFANPNKEFPQNFDPSRPFKTELLRRVSRGSFVDSVNGRNGPSRVVLLDDKILEDPTTFKLELESPLEVELRNNATYVVVHPSPPIPELYTLTLLAKPEGELPDVFDPKSPGSDVDVQLLTAISRQGFIRAVDRQNGGFVVALEDYPSRDVSKKDAADIELHNGATYIVLPPKGKNYEQIVDDAVKWQGSQIKADERHVRNKIVKYLEDGGHINVQPVCFQEIHGLGDEFIEVDAAAIADGCVMVAEHKNVLDVDSAIQLRTIIKFIEKNRDLPGVGNVSQFKGKRILGAVAGAVETTNQTNRALMDKIIKVEGYEKFFTDEGYTVDPCSSFQASGALCDAPAPSDAPANGPTAPSAVPRRGGRSLLAPMRGPAMLVRLRLVNNRVACCKLSPR